MSAASSKQRIGVVCITPTMENPSGIDFDVLYEAVGKNTGNFMFTQAMFRMLNGDVRQIGFGFDPDIINRECDIVVIPAANWLNARAEWDWLTARIEKLSVPVVLFGIGLQADTMDLAGVQVSESAKRLMITIARKSELISVRGHFTAAWLKQQGIDNVVATGCPSIYMSCFEGTRMGGVGPVAIQSTRYWVTRAFVNSNDPNRLLFEIAGRLALPMIFQSEPEEMEYLIRGKWRDTAAIDLLRGLYGLASSDLLENYIRSQGKVFFDLKTWSRFVGTTCGVIGTRLHGAILALNSGVPAVLIPHDSRTAEVAEFAAIPVVPLEAVRSDMSHRDLQQLLEVADVERYRRVRASNAGVFRDFLLKSGLTPQETEIYHGSLAV